MTLALPVPFPLLCFLLSRMRGSVLFSCLNKLNLQNVSLSLCNQPLPGPPPKLSWIDAQAEGLRRGEGATYKRCWQVLGSGRGIWLESRFRGCPISEIGCWKVRAPPGAFLGKAATGDSKTQQRSSAAFITVGPGAALLERSSAQTGQWGEAREEETPGLPRAWKCLSPQKLQLP